MVQNIVGSFIKTDFQFTKILTKYLYLYKRIKILTGLKILHFLFNYLRHNFPLVRRQLGRY